MNDIDFINRGSSLPALFSLFQLLTMIINPKSRKGVFKLLNYRNLAWILLSGLFWRLDSAFDFRTKLRRLVEGRAILRSSDESHKWLMLFLTKHPKFQDSPRNVEVTTKIPTSADKEVDASGLPLPDKQDLRILRQDFMYEEGKGKRQEQEDRFTEQGRIEKKRKEVVFKPAPSVTMHFVFQGTHFWVRRDRREEKDGKAKERLTLTYWSLKSTPLNRLLDHAQDLYLANQEVAVKNVCMYRMDTNGSWKSPKVAIKRTHDTLHLAGSIKEEIFADARTFFSEKGLQKYANRTIPYRRGFMFYGPPGNGKSTLCHVLASELGEDIYILDLGSASIDDDKFLRAMSRLPDRCILLIEDIDAAFVDREEVPLSSTEKDKSKKSSISFSAVLNGIDGVDAAVGRLLCVTTNHIEKIDKALIRPGRVDRKFEIGNAIPEQAKDLFIRWFTPKASGGPLEDVQSQADTFAKSIPAYKMSVAALQGYLLECDDDMQRAVQEVDIWVKGQEV